MKSEEIEKIVSEYIDEQVGLDIVNIIIRYDGEDIEVFRKDRMTASEASENEWGEMGGELANILNTQGYPDYGLYCWSPNGFGVRKIK